MNYIKGNNVKDKIISLGEKSFLNVSFLEAKNSAIELVSKDLSNLTIYNYVHKNVQLTIAAFIKKTEFVSPSVTVKQMKPRLFNENFIAKDSNVFISNEKINGSKSSIEISKLLYGNLYGVKTKR